MSPKAKTLRKGFSGGYFYKAVRSSNGAQYNEAPCKNKFSHAQDALQYALISGGEGDVIRGKERRRNSGGPRMAADIDYDVLNYSADTERAQGGGRSRGQPDPDYYRRGKGGVRSSFRLD